VRSSGDTTVQSRAADAITVAAIGGDREAIRMLWEQHRRWVAAVLLAHKPSFEDLDDLLQEVAVTVVSKINTLRNPAHLKAWLRTVSINAARAAGRSGRYRQTATLPEHELPAAGKALADELGQHEHVRRMLSRVRELPETYREPLLLRALHGMRSKQIAEVLGVTPATVDTRVARARRLLLDAERQERCGEHEEAGPLRLALTYEEVVETAAS